jgi:hypothetical protein
MASQKPHQDERLEIPDDATKVDLEGVLAKLVETGSVSAEEVNDLLDQMRTTTHGHLKSVAEVKEKQLSPEEQKALLGTLKSRFETNRKLHEKVQWADVEKALLAHPEKLWSLRQLEATGGEPDVIDEENGEYVFGDCSTESPSGRRNVVFDKGAEEYLEKQHPNKKCNGNAADMVAEYGADFMTEDQYRALQEKLTVDCHSWSFLKTHEDIRNSGRALGGSRDAGYVHVSLGSAYFHDDDGAFRASLRVLKA